MRYETVYIATAWTSPFMRWLGPAATLSSLDLAVDVTGRALQRDGIDPASMTDIVLGTTVPQQGSFYASTTVAGRLGAGHLTGPVVSQACATSVAALQAGAASLALGVDRTALVVTTDRTSNGPTLIHPDPLGMGGAPRVENWVLDNFAADPYAQMSPTAMAERVAEEAGMTRSELDDLTLQRTEQYLASTADDRARQRRFMVDVHVPRGRGEPLVISEDHGVHVTTAEGLAKLSPLSPDGVVTFGNQTHPADASAGMVLTGRERAEELSLGRGTAQLLATSMARVGVGDMPKAPVPAALAALDAAGLSLDAIDIVTCHTPFAVNDVWFSTQTGFPLDRMSPWGCSLVYGHPQAPVGARSIAELIEALRERGGGIGLFTGCAAGDTGAAAVVAVR